MSAEVDEPPLAAGGSAAVVRSFYAAFETEDHEAAIRPLISTRFVWHVAGENPLAGTFRGHTQLFAAMRRYAERSEGTLRLNTQSILGDGAHAVAIHAATGNRNGQSYSAHEIDVFHVENGMITEMWSFSEDQAATDAMWS
ncbi:MAG: nuclear transport factor 2 family protein [Acidimicrobiales bacterium]